MPNSKIPERVMPGIMTEMIDNYIETDPLATSRGHNLSLDLKKINSNKQDELGGIDLSSFEKPPTKYELEQRSELEATHAHEVIKIIDDLMNNMCSDNIKIPDSTCKALIEHIQKLVYAQSMRIRDLRAYLAGKEYGL